MRTILPMRRLKGTGGLPGPLTQAPTIPADWPADRPFTCVDLADPDGTRVSEWKGGRWVDITGTATADEAIAAVEAHERRRGETEG